MVIPKLLFAVAIEKLLAAYWTLPHCDYPDLEADLELSKKGAKLGSMSLKPGSLRVQLSPRSFKVVNFVNFQNNVSENIKIKSKYSL